MGKTLAMGMGLACVLVCRLSAAVEPSAPLAVRGDARPSFQIMPLVQRFPARPGQRMKFSFDVKTLAQPQSLRIRAVSLKQQPSGLLVADESAPPPDAVELFSPSQLDLKADQTATIRGHVDVPRSPAPFHAYGILVTDLGRPFQSGQPGSGNQAGIAVRFVTQYLLRVELDIKGGRQEDAKELRLESASLVDRDGQPMVEVNAANPTESGVEFQLYCRFLQSDGTQAVPAFGLALPARASRPEPQRYESLIFGQSRVQLAAPVSRPLFPGEYQLELEWISRGRKCGKTTTPVSVREGDFPAQASKFAQVAGTLCVTPSQIELSHGRGGTRRLPLTISNPSSRPLQIRLMALGIDGTPADWVLLQPHEFLLPARRDRNVLITAQPGDDAERHRYGWVRVEVRDGETVVGTRDLPLALLAAAPVNVSLAAGTLRWDQSGVRPAFLLPVDNQGSVHVPLNGRLTLTNASGQRLEVPGGFDRWLLPGQQDEIRFPLHVRLAPGLYSVTGQIRTGESDELTISQKVQVQ